MAARRSAPSALLLAAFIGVPLVEIYLLVQVGSVIGAGWTIALLVLDSVVGVALVRREGTKAWRELRRSLAEGRPPTRELADGALLLVGATLLVTPGFLTDAAGLLLVLPFTRPLLRGATSRWIAARLSVVPPSGRGGPFGAGAFGAGPYADPRRPDGSPGPQQGPGRPGGPSRTDDGVVPGVVVDSHDEPPQDPDNDAPPRR